MTHFSECIPVVKQHISVFSVPVMRSESNFAYSWGNGRHCSSMLLIVWKSYNVILLCFFDG